MDSDSSGSLNQEIISHDQSSGNLPLQLLEEITDSFSDERILGNGAFGVVYKGVQKNGEIIAVKKLKSLLDTSQKQFENEVYHLMKLKHRNIVQLVGYCYETKHVCLPYNGKFVFAEMIERLLCLEYMPNGSLDAYISDADADADDYSGLDWITRYKIIEGICDGLNYLHKETDKPIIHLDLKPANILLDHDWVPKISDFGLSRLFDQQQTLCTTNCLGTFGYMAPEAFKGKISPKSDIFSLGVIIIEVITGERDYANVDESSSEEFVECKLEKWRKKLEKEPGCTNVEIDCQQIKRCIQIGLMCVKDDWKKRPTTTEIINMLRGSESMDCYLHKGLTSPTDKASSLIEEVRRRPNSGTSNGGSDDVDLATNDPPRLELPHFQLNKRSHEEEEEEVTGGEAPARRRLWVKDRSRAWWDRCNSADFPEADFRTAFHMGRETFDMICDTLHAAVAKEDTMLRAAIPVRQRVAVCIRRLATGEPLRLVSKRFGLGISTCHKLVLEVCAAIKGVLMPRFLRWPDAVEAARFKDRFQADSGIPGVVGAIYTTHVPIIAPKFSVAAYFNRRHTERNHRSSYSITLQAVIAPDGTFTDVCIGWPGSMPDDQVLDRSMVPLRFGTSMMAGSWVVGGVSFPLTDWLLAPYLHPDLTLEQHAFNEKVADIRRVAVEAFARLKSRWACLQKRTEVKVQDLPVVLGACCVLHNICETRGEEMDPDIRCELADYQTVPDKPMRSESASKARDDIAHDLLHSGLAGTS